MNPSFHQQKPTAVSEGDCVSTSISNSQLIVDSILPLYIPKKLDEMNVREDNMNAKKDEINYNSDRFL